MAADGSLVFDTGIDSSGFTKGLSTLAATAGTAAAAITTAFTGAAAAAVSVGTSYTSAMSQVAATMGITTAAEDYELLSAAAKEMGATTKYSASQAAEALNYLALAGYDAQQSVSALPTVLNLAAAGGIDLAYASDMVTDSMSALGLGMEELDGFADQLAKTSQKSNTSVAQLGEAILTVGGTAKSLAGGVNELNTMLGVIADNGVKGAEGGTALRNVILSLSAPTSKAAGALDELGISAYDLDGNLRYLPDVFADFNDALSTLTEGEKTQVLNTIFNKVDLKTVNALLGTSAERFDELAGYIENCDGAAAQMAETMSDNLEGDMLAMQSALEAVGVSAFEKFENPLRGAVQAVTSSLSDLNSEISNGELSESLQRISAEIGSLITDLGKFASNNALPFVINAMELIVVHGGEIISVAAGIAVAVKGMKLVPVMTSIVNVFQKAQISVALLSMEMGLAHVTTATLNGTLTASEVIVSLLTGKITLATAAQAAFNAVASINPFVWVVTAVAAVVTAVGLYINHINKSKTALSEAAEETNEYTEAMEKVRDAGQDNIDKSNAEIGVIREKADRYEELRQRYENLTRGEMAEFKELAEELQGILPEGTQIINEQTGAYNSLADSIDKVCQNMEKQAVLNAKYSEFEEAAAQNYDIDNQLKAIQDIYDKKKEDSILNADLYAAEGYDFDKNVSLNSIANDLYGLSYDDLVKQRSENQQIIDDYHQLYEDTYNELNNVGTGEYDNPQRTAAEAYAADQSNRWREAAEGAAEEQEKVTKKLEAGWKELEHQYAIGEIATEQELYEKKKELLDKYGNSSLEDHWKYYEELYGYEKDFAEDEKKLAEERAENAKKSTSDFIDNGWAKLDHDYAAGIIADDKELYEKRKEFLKSYCDESNSEYWKYYEQVYDYEKEQAERRKKLSEDAADKALKKMQDNHKKELSEVKENLSSILSEYSKAYSDYESNVKSYKAKLLSVGDVFTFKTETDKDGNVTKTYTVENLKKQMEQMRKYHEYIKKLKEQGASRGLIEELTSMDFEQGAQFGQFLAGMSSSEFNDINELYKERDALAQELAEDMYSDDLAFINTALHNSIYGALEGLPEQAQAAGKAMLEGILSGIDISSADLTEHISAFSEGFSEMYENAIENMDLKSSFDYAFAGIDTYSMGTDMAAQFASGFKSELSRLNADVNAGQVSFGVAASGANAAAGTAKSEEKISLETTIHTTVELDGNAVGKSVTKYQNESTRRRGA